MSASNTSVAPSPEPVNVYYYSVQPNRRVERAQARLSPEQIQAANEHAAKLRAQDAVLLRGPIASNGMIQVPSWRWNPELVSEVKSRTGYHFEEKWPYTIRVTLHGHDYTPTVTMPTWTSPAEPGRLEQIKAVYERVFARELATARMAEMLRPLGRF